VRLVGIKKALKGEVPAGFIVLKVGTAGPAEVERQCFASCAKKLARSPVSMSRSPAPVALGEKFTLHNEKDVDKES